MDLVKHNRAAWNHEVQTGNKWTIPVSSNDIAKARAGQYSIVLTPTKGVPKAWLGDVRGKSILCLASGGGQQGPTLAAAGALVTVFDNSDEQLRRDEQTALANGLGVRTVQGNMQNLDALADDSFEMIVHPVSNNFVDDIVPVWKECYRVLRKSGALLSGFLNPIAYMIDWDDSDRRHVAEIRNAIPYSDYESLSESLRKKYLEELKPFEFGHSLTDQIQGQIDAGFVIAGLYEDKGEPVLDAYTDVCIATRALKL